jgi:hypothetical protein
MSPTSFTCSAVRRSTSIPRRYEATRFLESREIPQYDSGEYLKDRLRDLPGPGGMVAPTGFGSQASLFEITFEGLALSAPLTGFGMQACFAGH